ncbi:MAG: DUF1097 domain-containing protein [Caulobacter sp.]|nr:DUF1097 domain-containing protein [Caulobacter sp.]
MSAANPPSLPPLRFHAVSLAVAAIAGVSTFGATSVMLPPPAMFLGWVAFSLAGPSLRGGFANLGSFLMGLVFGLGTALTITALTPALGGLATPVAVSGVVVLVLSLRGLAPFNNPLAYFLGLTSFFYSGLAPAQSSFSILAAAGAIGAASAAIAALAERFVHGQGAPKFAAGPAVE